MREVKPYKTREGLQRAIDNGGRFYKFFPHANAHVVSKGELAKAAGVCASDQTAFLFLELAYQGLRQSDREYIVSMLEPVLREKFRRKRPKTFQPSQVERDGTPGDAVVITGYPRFIEDKTQFSGFISVPITTGKVTTYAMIPIFDRFDVYELFDDDCQHEPSAMIAAETGKKFVSGTPVRLGGFLRKLESKNQTEPTHDLYLECVFYSRLG